MARDISSERLRKLQNEQRGVPSYPLDSSGRKKGRPNNGQTPDEYANDLSLAQSRLHEDLTRAGVDPASVHPNIQNRVVGALVRGEHSDPLTAYERTVGAMKGPPDASVKSTTVLPSALSNSIMLSPHGLTPFTGRADSFLVSLVGANRRSPAALSGVPLPAFLAVLDLEYSCRSRN